MSDTRVRSLLLLPLFAFAAACGDDDGGGDPVEDVGTDAGSGDTGTDTDVSTDVAPDVADDVETDEGSGTDVAPDIDEGPCPGSIECLDERTGNPSVAVCTEGGFPSGTICSPSGETACCVAPTVCESDEACEANRAEEPFCADSRYPCACLDNGACGVLLCSSDDECADGETCLEGRCEAPVTGDYVARILTQPNYVTPETTITVEAVAVLESDPNITNPALDIEWTLLEGDASLAVDGTLTFNDGEPGDVVVRATVADNDSDPGDTVTFTNPGSLAEGTLRITVIDEYTRERITTAQVLVTEADTSFPTEEDGTVIVELAGTTDVHIFAPGYAYVSFINVGGDVLAALPPTSTAEIREVRDGFVCDTAAPNTFLDDTENCGDDGQFPCLCYTGTGLDVVGGQPSFDNVATVGEVAVAISGFSLGNTLLDLNFDLIVGPQIGRVFPETSPIPLDGETDIPSGVTLAYNGDPFVNQYVATAPPGERTVWSVGGIVQLSDVLLDLLPYIEGDVDLGSIITALLPFFDDFYSGLSAPVTLDSSFTLPVRDPGIDLTVPTLRRVSITPPSLPDPNGVFLDTGIFLGGVLVPGEGFVPTGISAGADAVGTEVPDGIIDGDLDEDGDNPVGIAMAPMHGSIVAPGSRYMFASVALLLGEDVAGAPREATSGLITLLEPGDSIPAELDLAAQTDFLPLATGAEWDPMTRTLAVGPLTEKVDLTRVVFQGPDSRLWIVYADDSVTSFVLPSPSDDLEFEDRTTNDRVNVVSIDLRDSLALDLATLVRPNATNLTELFTFIDGFSIIGL
jgi:hypothetical protein